MILDWDDEQAAVARMALSMLSYCTDTGAERGLIAGMLADLGSSGKFSSEEKDACPLDGEAARDGSAASTLMSG